MGLFFSISHLRHRLARRHDDRIEVYGGMLTKLNVGFTHLLGQPRVERIFLVAVQARIPIRFLQLLNTAEILESVFEFEVDRVHSREG